MELILSIIHVDVNFSDLYTGLIDVNMSSMQDRISDETHEPLLNWQNKQVIRLPKHYAVMAILVQCWLMP